MDDPSASIAAHAQLSTVVLHSEHTLSACRRRPHARQTTAGLTAEHTLAFYPDFGRMRTLCSSLVGLANAHTLCVDRDPLVLTHAHAWTRASLRSHAPWTPLV